MSFQYSVEDDTDELMRKFEEFQLVDLRRNKKTVYEKLYYIRRFFAALRKAPYSVTTEDIKEYLKSLSGISAAAYKNVLGALKVFFRDFLMMPDLVQSFKFPRQLFRPRRIFSKQELQRFYDALATPKE